MHTEAEVRSGRKQLQGLRRPRAGHHQAARAGYTVLDRGDDGFVHRLVHAQVIAIEDQHPLMEFEAQQLI
jgi:hypothetical protein